MKKNLQLIAYCFLLIGISAGASYQVFSGQSLACEDVTSFQSIEKNEIPHEILGRIYEVLGQEAIDSFQGKSGLDIFLKIFESGRFSPGVMMQLYDLFHHDNFNSLEYLPKCYCSNLSPRIRFDPTIMEMTYPNSNLPQTWESQVDQENIRRNTFLSLFLGKIKTKLGEDLVSSFANLSGMEIFLQIVDSAILSPEELGRMYILFENNDFQDLEVLPNYFPQLKGNLKVVGFSNYSDFTTIRNTHADLEDRLNLQAKHNELPNSIRVFLLKMINNRMEEQEIQAFAGLSGAEIFKRIIGSRKFILKEIVYIFQFFYPNDFEDLEITPYWG